MEAPRWQVRQERFPYRVEEEIPGDRHTPAEDENLGVENRREARTGSAEPAAEFAQCLHGAGVTRGDEGADLVAREDSRLGARVCEGQADAADVRNGIRHPQQGTSGPVLLDASTRATSARQPVGNDPEMPDLGSRTEAAAKQPVLCHDCAADAGANGEHRHVAVQPTGAEPEFCPSRGIGIVVDRDVDIQSFEQSCAEGFVAPADVGCVVDSRLGSIDEACRGNTGGNNLTAGGQALDHVDDGVHNRGRIARGRWPTFLDEDLAFIGHDGSGDLRSTNVDSDGMHDLRVYRKPESCSPRPGSNVSPRHCG